MNEENCPDTREIAQSIKGQKPPYVCPCCSKEYRSHTGIMYHIGQFGPPSKVPRCFTETNSVANSPRSSSLGAPGSPAGGTIKKTAKVPRRDLTWAEAQQIVEFEFDTCYKRLEIDTDIEIERQSEEEDTGKKKGPGAKTPQKKGQGFTPRGKSAKNKGKRRSKLKTPGKGDVVPLPKAETVVLEGVDAPDAPNRSHSYYRFVEMNAEDLDELVEYDIDEEDSQWLQLMNEDRKQQGLTAVPQEAFEILMDRLEKECFFESRTTGDSNDVSMYNIDENAVCCICNDGECHNTNAILFCDMCNLAIHQECYGVPYIPEGQWLCRRCLQSPSRSVDCILCPIKGGAFKQTLDGRWAHVICALWIPEVRFANPVFLEPIDGIKEIPIARWKLTCQVCHRRMGACIQCAKQNCYAAFHVTCAQQDGLQMAVEVQKNGDVKKLAYCRLHSQRKRKGNKPDEGKEEGVAEDDDEKQSSKEGGGASSENGVDVEEVAEEDEEGGGNGGGDEQEDGGGATEGGEGAGKAASAVKGKGSVKKVTIEEKKSSTLPVVNIPYVPQHRLDRIIGRVSLHKKSQFIPKLVGFWKLKRQSRNGVPLLRRMQASNQGQRTATNLTEEEREVLSQQLSQWKTLRHDLERARLLAELVRKREKLKREQLRMLQQTNELQLCPLNTVMKRILDRLARKDPADIFAEVVNAEEVPDYLDVIKQPMDFGTMRKRVESHHYANLDEFESDFYLVWHNATVYNAKDTIYYRAAIRIKDAGEKILQQAREQVESAGVNQETGLHDPDVDEPPPLTPSTLANTHNYADEILNEDFEEEEEEVVKKFRDRLPSATLDEQIEYLEEKLEIIQGQYTGYPLKRKEKNLRLQLNAVRRQIRQQRPRNSDSDDQVSSPRRPLPSSTPRNAEGLASHVLHGSLRLTPSRQQILSYSGISLPDGPRQLLDERRDKSESAHGASKEVESKAEEEEEEEEEEEKEESGEGVSEKESESGRGTKMGVGGRGRRRAGADERSSGEETGSTNAQLKNAGSDTYIQQVRKHAHRIRKQKVQRLAANNHQGNSSSDITTLESRRSERSRTSTRKALASVKQNKVSLSEAVPAGLDKRRRLRGSYSSTRSGYGSSSSIADMTTTGGEYGSEDRVLFSPLSDSGLYQQARHQKLDTLSVPSASSLEDLTVKSPLQAVKHNQQERGRRTPRGTPSNQLPGEDTTGAVDKGEERGGGGGGGGGGRGGGRKGNRKRSRRGDGGGSSTRKRRRVVEKKNSVMLNGVVNGGQEYTVVLWDLVWAKCRGYPPYPALVVDPDMSRKGLIVNGERIRAPSEEVLEIQKKNPSAPYLVRFFDGKRSWQWLPEEKIEALGASAEQDSHKIAMSGHSKRSVMQAFQRAKQYQRKVESRTHPHIVENDSESDDSES